MKAVKWVFLVIGTVVLAGCIYLLAVAVLPGFEVPDQPLQEAKRVIQMPREAPSTSRKEASFDVKGTEIGAWLYLPRDVSEPCPCIVMASGLGGTKDMGEGCALRFQGAGFAVLAFDYRYFGQSKGEPRQLIWIPYQLEDWAAAVAYARG